jgi:hypothetical protein
MIGQGGEKAGEGHAMNVKYTDRVGQGGEALALLQHATKLLEGVLGRSAPRVEAAWDRAEDGGGRALYTLRLSEGTEEASARFTPDELRDAGGLRYRLLRLWGDLLQERSHRQLQELLSGGREGE